MRHPQCFRWWESFSAGRVSPPIYILEIIRYGCADETEAVSIYMVRHSVRIDAAAAPASPTAEQLAQAVAYEAEQADDN